MRRAALVTLLTVGAAMAMAQMPDEASIQHTIPQVGTIDLPKYFERVWRTPAHTDQHNGQLDALIRIQREKQQPTQFVAQRPIGRFKVAPGQSIACLVQAEPKDASPFSQIAMLDTGRTALAAYDQACRRRVAEMLPADQTQLESWIAPRVIRNNTLTYECQYRIGKSELRTVIALLCIDSERVYHVALTGPHKSIEESREQLMEALHSFTPLSSSNHLLESK